MNAMTWYDHETRSIWSQPWGRAIDCKLKGVELFLLPFQLTTWENWKTAYLDSLVMTNDLDRMGWSHQGFYPKFVVGLILGEDAKAYYYIDIFREVVINDQMGNFPVLVWASEAIYHAYIRMVDDHRLTFIQREDHLVDEETGSIWEPVRCLAVKGPLKGKSLQPVPSLSSYDWAWDDFYPGIEFYEP